MERYDLVRRDKRDVGGGDKGEGLGCGRRNLRHIITIVFAVVGKALSNLCFGGHFYTIRRDYGTYRRTRLLRRKGKPMID